MAKEHEVILSACHNQRAGNGNKNCISYQETELGSQRDLPAVLGWADEAPCWWVYNFHRRTAKSPPLLTCCQDFILSHSIINILDRL